MSSTGQNWQKINNNSNSNGKREDLVKYQTAVKSIKSELDRLGGLEKTRNTRKNRLNRTASRILFRSSNGVI